MKRPKLVVPQCRVTRSANVEAYTVSVSIPEAWLDMDGETFHRKMDDTLGALMRVFEQGRTERARERREEGGI